jgi:hypothetical protein
LLPAQLGLNDSHEIISRLFASIVAVNKSDKAGIKIEDADERPLLFPSCKT